jgi:hypothetical protein
MDSAAGAAIWSEPLLAGPRSGHPPGCCRRGIRPLTSSRAHELDPLRARCDRPGEGAPRVLPGLAGVGEQRSGIQMRAQSWIVGAVRSHSSLDWLLDASLRALGRSHQISGVLDAAERDPYILSDLLAASRAWGSSGVRICWSCVTSTSGGSSLSNSTR